MNYLDLKANPKEGYDFIYKYTSPSGKKLYWTNNLLNL